MLKYAIIAIVAGFVQVSSVQAQVRHFNIPELTGVDIAVREVLTNDSEQLICFRHIGPVDQDIIAIFEVVDNRLNKVWKHHHPAIGLAYGFDTGDLDNDGQLDFVVVGRGQHKDRGVSSDNHVLLYLSNGDHRHYESQVLARPRQVFRTAIGDIDGDGQQELIIAETVESTMDWYNVELKIVRYRNGSFTVTETGIAAKPPETSLNVK